MTPQQRVYKVCDRISAEGKEDVDVQAVIDEMKRKPPYRAMARGAVMLHVRGWKVERAYKPRLDVRVLPEPLQAGLAELAKTVWEARWSRRRHGSKTCVAGGGGAARHRRTPARGRRQA